MSLITVCLYTLGRQLFEQNTLLGTLDDAFMGGMCHHVLVHVQVSITEEQI
jgi:hypothetical protein